MPGIPTGNICFWQIALTVATILMSKQNKAQTRKAKLKAKKQQAIYNQQLLTEHLSIALEKLCEPVLPEYIDDSNGQDLTGRHIVWQLGMIAWNIHVTGRKELAECAFAGLKLDAKQQAMVRKEIAGLVQMKIELYSRQMTAIRNVAATLVNGSPRAKARPGDTFPEPPGKPVSEPEKPITAEDIAALRKVMKITQVKFAELFGVTARKVSEWEHGKTVPAEYYVSILNKLSKQSNL